MLSKVLENVSTIAIGGHIRPDGDCVGSCVGLGQYIRENYSDKTVDIFSFLKRNRDNSGVCG